MALVERGSGEVERDRRRAGRCGRRTGHRCDQALPAVLVAARVGGPSRALGADGVRGPGGDRPDLQQVRAAARGRVAQRGARAGRAGWRERGGGVPSRREPANDRDERVRVGARQDEARCDLRHADPGLPGRSGSLGRRPRAVARRRQGCDSQPDLARDRRAGRHASCQGACRRAPRRDARRAGSSASVGACGRNRLGRDRSARQSALTPHRGARRPLRTRPDR